MSSSLELEEKEGELYESLALQPYDYVSDAQICAGLRKFSHYPRPPLI
jgi:hypothetical protein